MPAEATVAGARARECGIDDMKSLLAALETIFDEWKEHSVFLSAIMKKRADVTVAHQARSLQTESVGWLSLGVPPLGLSDDHKWNPKTHDRCRLNATVRGIEKSPAGYLHSARKHLPTQSLYALVDAKRFYAHCAVGAEDLGGRIIRL